MSTITNPQKEVILRLMRKQEFDMSRASLMHEQLAKSAGIMSPNGALVDDWVGSLNRTEASDLINILRDM